MRDTVYETWPVGASFPDLGALKAGLNSVFREHDPRERLSVLAREPNPRPGKRWPGEVVTVRRRDGSRHRLFCKYEDRTWHSHGLWGVAYEVEVYRHVLAIVDATTPKFYGAFEADSTGRLCLILEYVGDTIALKSSSQPGAMVETARWLARFHAATEQLVLAGATPFLKTLDGAYYRGWAERILEFAASRRHRLPWLTPLCRKWVDLAEMLLLPANCIIHGDFYNPNVMMSGNTPFVIDWESASVGVGEIDLAFHTEGWPEEIVRLCVAEYGKTRWPESPPPEYLRKLQAARLYHHFRWLGDHAEWSSPEALRKLREIAAKM